MIVDCYTHTWESPDQLGRCLPSDSRRAPLPEATTDPLDAAPSRHAAASEPVDATIVLGFTAHHLDAEIPNDQVASYVNTRPDRLIGFAGIDPSRPQEAVAELDRARSQLAMPGIAVSPAAQDFHPSNSQAMRVYAEAAERGMPVVFHTGIYLAREAKLEYARPVLLDEVARELPKLKMIIAHMGFPWVGETVMMLAKHARMYAEISGLLSQPWQAYQALTSAYQSGVMDKLLFGTGFPFGSAADTIEALYSINHLCHGTNLPTIPREQLRGIVERDALGLLGIPHNISRATTLQPTPDIPDDDETEDL